MGLFDLFTKKKSKSSQDKRVEDVLRRTDDFIDRTERMLDEMKRDDEKWRKGL